jgi:hypothetical protein
MKVQAKSWFMTSCRGLRGVRRDTENASCSFWATGARERSSYHHKVFLPRPCGVVVGPPRDGGGFPGVFCFPSPTPGPECFRVLSL